MTHLTQMDTLTYFDILPLDINLLIMSKLDLVSDRYLLSYDLHKKLLIDETWKRLFILKFPKQHEFVIHVKNIRGSSTWNIKVS